MKIINFPCVLTIAGTDPSGGAGIQADIKAITATGSYAASIITALVAQNTKGVQAIEEVSSDFLVKQIDSVFSDLKISAVKIGMLHNEKVIETIENALIKLKPKNIVLDPVMVAKNGCELLPLNIIDFLKNRLLPLVHLITPNIFEAEKIWESKIDNLNKMEQASEELGKYFKLNVLIKGGHLKSEQSPDVLYSFADNHHHWFHAKRIDTKNTHGTGCTFSSAIASYLANDYPLPNAIAAAKAYLTNAIKYGSKMKIGKGAGPVNHFYFLESDNSSRKTSI